MVPDQPQHGLRILPGIIEPNQAEIAVAVQDLKVLQYFLVAGVHRARAAVGMLPVPEAGVADRLLDATQQGAGFLLNRRAGFPGCGRLCAPGGRHNEE